MLDQRLKEEQETSIKKANYDLLDQFGIMQHHDAITGTARQAVANDYNLRLNYGMNQINLEYGKLIDEKIK